MADIEHLWEHFHSVSCCGTRDPALSRVRGAGSQSLNLRDQQLRGAGVYIAGSDCGKRTSVSGCIEISCVFLSLSILVIFFLNCIR